MKLLLRVTFKDMLVANSIGISLAQKLSRGDRSAFVLARWCKLGGALTPLDLIWGQESLITL